MAVFLFLICKRKMICFFFLYNNRSHRINTTKPVFSISTLALGLWPPATGQYWTPQPNTRAEITNTRQYCYVYIIMWSETRTNDTCHMILMLISKSIVCQKKPPKQKKTNCKNDFLKSEDYVVYIGWAVAICFDF